MSSKSIGNLKIKSIQIGKRKVLLIFYDGSNLEISPNSYVDFSLYKDKEITAKEYKQIIKRNDFDKEYQYALTLVSSSSYSEKEIERKLSSRGVKKENIGEIITKIKNIGLIDDDKYLEEYIDYGNRKLYGKNKIIYNLKQKGIDVSSDYLDDEIEEIKAEKLLPVLISRYSNESYHKRKIKVHDSYLRFGFSHEIAHKYAAMVDDKNSKIEKEKLKKEYKKLFEKYKIKYKGYELKEVIRANLLRKGYAINDIKEILH